MKKIFALMMVLFLAMPGLSAAESAGAVYERGEMFEAVFPIRGDMPGAKMLRVSVLCDPAAFEVLVPGEIESTGRITYPVHLEDGAARGLWVRVLPDAVPGSYRISLTVHTVLGENAVLQAVGVTAAPLQVTVGASLSAQAPADTPLLSHIGKLNAALDAGRRSREEMDRQMREAQAEAAKAREELAGAQEGLAAMTANYTLAKEEATAVKEKLETAHKRLATLIGKIRAAQEIALRLSDDLANTRKELYYAKAQLDTEIAKNETLTARLLEAEAQLKVKTQEVIEKDAQIVLLTADLDNTKGELYLTRETLEQVKAQLAKSREDLEKAQETIRQKEAEIAKLQNDLTALTESFEALKAENESLRDQLASVQTSITELTNALEEEKRKNQALTEENQALKEENAAQTEEIKALKERVAALEAALAEKTEVCEDLRKEAEEVSQKLAVAEQEKGELEVQVRKLTEEKKEIAYQKAEALFQDRDFVAAREIYLTIPGYRDADEKAAACDEAIAAWNARLTVGQYVTLGRYPQSASGKDRTPIEWLVLEVKGDKALLLSRRGLDAMPYNTVDGVLDWTACSLRQWLNRDFMAAAFTDDEKRVVAPTVLVSTLKQYTEGYAFSVDTTRDQVFLLSHAEVSKYLPVLAAESGSARYSVPLTEYAARRGGNTNGILGGKTGWWWLRLPGDNRSVSAYVMGGNINAASLYYTKINNPAGVVRPAIWVTLKDGALRP